MKKTIFLSLAIMLCFLFTPRVIGDELTHLKEEIERLRHDYQFQLKELQSQIETLGKNQDKKIAQVEEKVDKKVLDFDYVGRYDGPFKKEGLIVENPLGYGNVSLGGYADIEFANFQNTNSTFNQHRWILNVGAELSERLRFFSEYEIEYGGPNAPAGDGEAKVEQAWIDYLINEKINLRAGALLVPFGRYNLYHDSDLQDLTDRPLVARRVIPTTWTDAGAGFHGEFNPRFGNYEDLTIGYEAYVMNGLNEKFSDTGLRGARPSLKRDNNNSKAAAARVMLSPFLGHEFGLSGYRGKYNNLNDYINGAAIDWLSTWGPLELVGEYAYFDIDEPSQNNVSRYMKGYYVQANYHFWPEFLNETFLGRGFENPTFTLVSRYGEVKIDDDPGADLGDNKESRFTFGFNYRPVESWVFKLEHQWNNTKNKKLEHGNNNGFMMSVAMGF